MVSTKSTTNLVVHEGFDTANTLMLNTSDNDVFAVHTLNTCSQQVQQHIKTVQLSIFFHPSRRARKVVLRGKIQTYREV